MAQVYVSIGSNIDRHQHITAALDALHTAFGELLISSVYESEAVGFSGENFYNLVAGFNTTMDVAGLSAVLRDIENSNGRQRDGGKFSARTLDIDLLTYDNSNGNIDGLLLPRPEILQNAFVLQPLAEIAPDAIHPAQQQCYASLWAAYDKPQKLWSIPFSWQGRQLGIRYCCNE